VGKPTATEDMLKALPFSGPSIHSLNLSGTSVSSSAVLATPWQFCEAVFSIGKIKVKVDLMATPDRIAKKICHRNGMCLPRSKAVKAYLYAMASQVVTDGQAAMKAVSGSDIVAKFEANNRRKASKEKRARRLQAEQELRSAMRKWDFSLEEVTLMWQEREVDAVHEH
jgi:hypothetical protein